MDGTYPHISYQKREDSIDFFRLIRSNRNEETLKRVCQHLSVLVAIDNNYIHPRSRNGHVYREDIILFPPNNTPAETVTPYISKIIMNRGIKNWQRISSIIIKKLRVVNAIKQYKRFKGQPHSSLDMETLSSNIIITDDTSSIVTVDVLITGVVSMSDISKVMNYDQHSRDDRLPLLRKALSDGAEVTSLGKSMYEYLKSSSELIERESQLEGPSTVQNVQKNAKARHQWHILSRTILILVRVAQILNLIKSPASPPTDSSAATSLGSVIFIKRPTQYFDSVSSGSFISYREHYPTIITTSSESDNSLTVDQLKKD